MKYLLSIFSFTLLLGCTKEETSNNSVLKLSVDISELFLDNIRTTDTITIQSSHPWEISVDTLNTWMDVTPLADSGSSKIVITTTEANHTGQDRSIQMEIKTTDGTERVVINITQKYILVPLGTAFGGEGDDVFTALTRTPELDYIAVGYSSSTQGDVSGNSGGKDLWIVRIDPSGKKVWHKTYGGSSDDAAYGIFSNFDGTYLVTGETSSADGDVSNPRGGKDAWVILIDGDGRLIWEKTLGTPADDAMTHVTHSASGDLAFTGVSEGDQWMGKMTRDATVIWEKRFGSSGDDIGVSVSESIFGLVFCGYGTVKDEDVADKPTATSSDAWIVATDNSGNILWHRYVGGENTETPVIASWMDNETIIVFGNTDSRNEFPGFTGDQHIFMSCFDWAGNFLWKKLLKQSDHDVITGLGWARHRRMLVFGKTLAADSSGQSTFDAAIWETSHTTGDVNRFEIFKSAGEEAISAITIGGVNENPLAGTTTTYPDSLGNSNSNSSGWFYTWMFP